MKYILVISLLFFVCSCNYFDVKKTSSEDILKDELQTFNWNELDAYPTFSVCDSLLTKQEKKQCFQNTLTHRVMQDLSEEHFIVSQDIEDTIQVTFSVSETGVLEITTIEATNNILSEIPDIKASIRKSMDSVTGVFPAIKRGQHVRSEFKLPIVIKAN